MPHPASRLRAAGSRLCVCDVRWRLPCWRAWAGWPWRRRHADLWAYVDEFGVTHFAAEALDERYKLFFKGELYDSSQPGLQLKPDSAAEGSTPARACRAFSRSRRATRA
jgi:hypothetical protein